MEQRFSSSIPSGSCILNGMYHLPSIGKPPFPTVLFFHGLGGTRVGRFRFLVQCSERLAQQGIASVRYDFVGSGDSTGSSLDWSLENFVQNGRDIVAWIAQMGCFDMTRLGIFGRSFGGVIALLTAQKFNIASLALFATPFDSALYKINNSSSPSGYIQGNPISQQFGQDIVTLSLQKYMQPLEKIPMLYIACALDTVVDEAHGRQLVAARGSSPTQYLLLPNSEHECEDIHDRTLAIETMSSWFTTTILHS